MQQQQVIVIWPAGKPARTRVHIDFKPEKHAIVAGNLCDKKSGRPLGIIQRVYTDAPAQVTPTFPCMSCGTSHANISQACPKPPEDL